MAVTGYLSEVAEMKPKLLDKGSADFIDKKIEKAGDIIFKISSEVDCQPSGH